MHYGQILQSHALHFFHLSSPDLLFGFDSDVARRNIVGVAAAFPRSPGRACCCAGTARKSSVTRQASASTARARCPAA